jgi:uncharacterized protein YkwD
VGRRKGTRAAACSFGVAVACTLVAAGGAAAATSGAGTVDPDVALAAEVVASINGARDEAGLAALRAVGDLVAASAAHAQAMAADGFFSHNSADGTGFARRIAQFYARDGSRRYAVGENILWSGRQLSADAAVAWWMRSDPHRGNILSRRFRDIGVIVLRVAAAPGTFGGRDITLVVAGFGVR